MRTTYICKEISGDAWRCLEMNKLFHINMINLILATVHHQGVYWSCL